MIRRLFTGMLTFLLAFGLTSNVQAQDYSFSLDKEVVHVYLNDDGTMSLDYNFFFTNDPNGHVIDFVDVGMPTWNYNFNSISADANGVDLGISTDFYGDGPYGFAVDMGGQAIRPGDSGQVHVYVRQVDDIFYDDSDDPNYASVTFSPAYFSTAHGSTDLTVIFHFPPGVTETEPRWHSAPSGFQSEPETGFDNEGRITYSWRNANASGYNQYYFGASFPKSYLPVDAIVVEPPPFVSTPSLSGIIDDLGGVACCGFFGLMFVGAPILGAINERKRKLQYLPPKISIEGHGIKRGLTAVEAGLLLEQPLDKVMTMILFGVVKKNAATVITRDPLKLQLVQPQPEGLHEYEKNFLTAFAAPDLAGQRKALQEMTVGLVKTVSDKMKGFSRKETIEYYKNIMEKAWQQIEAAGTPEVKSQMFEQAMEWTMLDKNYDDRTRRVFTGPVYVPIWWGNYDPSYQSVSAGARVAASGPVQVGGRGAPASVPGASFAASVVGGVQNFSSRVLGNVQSFTSGVTNRTNPPPKPSSSGMSHSGGSSGGSSGGRSCACACACAGCACACAGGGR